MITDNEVIAIAISLLGITVWTWVQLHIINKKLDKLFLILSHNNFEKEESKCNHTSNIQSNSQNSFTNTIRYRIKNRFHNLQRKIPFQNKENNKLNDVNHHNNYTSKQLIGNRTSFEQIVLLPQYKKENPEYKQVSSQTLQNVLERLDLAYKAFYRRIKSGEKAGFPRFKGFNRYDSFLLKNTGWRLDGRILIIRHIGQFKIKLSRMIEGDIKTISVRRTTTGEWYACFSCDNVPVNILPENNEIVGLDVGIKSFLTDSKGNKAENPKYLKHSLKELRIKQRKLARAKRGSNRRKKTKLQVAKCHDRITNQRQDYLHKVSHEYVSKYGTIVVEKLNVKGMVRNHKLARDITDASWGIFVELLSYKAEEAGRKLIQVNPRNTSKTCSHCGAINTELKLSDREWVCMNCGTFHDRDINAAKNIERLGQSHQVLTKEVALCVA